MAKRISIAVGLVILALSVTGARAAEWECPEMLKDRLVQRAALNAIGHVATGGDFRSETLRIYQIIQRGPSLAEVEAAWDRLTDDPFTVVALCFPHLRAQYLKVMTQRRIRAEEEQRLAAEQAARNKADQEAREAAKKAAEETARQQQELWRKRDEAARREAAKPHNQLLRAYTAYVIVKQCHDQRDGYMAVYVSDTEFERAREAMRVIQNWILARDPSLPTEELWTEANRQGRVNFYSGYKWTAYREMCQNTLASILNVVPAPPVVKDF